MKKIGILGGTFDPVHNGHLYLAQTAFTVCGLDEVVFLPLNVPPHKKPPVADSQTRFNMLKKATESIPHFRVSDREINRRGTTYTVDTLREVKEVHPDWEVYYIIGTDSLYDLHKWKDIEAVFSLCTFVCMSRPGEDVQKQQDYADRLAENYKGRIIVIEVMGKDVSSTRIKDVDTDKLKKMVPPQILDEVTKIYVKEDLS